MDRNDPRAIRTHRAVLEATITLLAERGVDATTMDAIARAAGISRSTLYRHWPERLPLLRDALDHVNERFDRSHPAEPTPDETLETALQRIIGGLGAGLRSAEWGPIAAGLTAAAEHDRAFAALLRRHVSDRRQVVVDLLQDARDRGELRHGLPPEWVAGLLAGPLYYHRLVLHRPLDEDQVTAHVRGTLALLRSTAPDPGPGRGAPPGAKP
jgi:AcrR family transcriptional regulator